MKKVFASITILSCVLLVALVGVALGGSNFGKTTFYDDVNVGTWSVIGGVASSATYSAAGTMTNGLQTNFYRICYTNLKGRGPVQPVTIVVEGNTNGSVAAGGTNSVILYYARKGGATMYIVEKSYDRGATWTNWTTNAPLYTNWTDLGSNVWSGTNMFTNAYSTIAAPVVPWGPTSGASFAWIRVLANLLLTNSGNHVYIINTTEDGDILFQIDDDGDIRVPLFIHGSTSQIRAGYKDVRTGFSGEAQLATLYVTGEIAGTNESVTLFQLVRTTSGIGGGSNMGADFDIVFERTNNELVKAFTMGSAWDDPGSTSTYGWVSVLQNGTMTEVMRWKSDGTIQVTSNGVSFYDLCTYGQMTAAVDVVQLQTTSNTAAIQVVSGRVDVVETNTYKLDGSQPLTAAGDAGAQRWTNAAPGIDGSDLTTKEQVEDLIQTGAGGPFYFLTSTNSHMIGASNMSAVNPISAAVWLTNTFSVGTFTTNLLGRWANPPTNRIIGAGPASTHIHFESTVAMNFFSLIYMTNTAGGAATLWGTTETEEKTAADVTADMHVTLTATNTPTTEFQIVELYGVKPGAPSGTVIMKLLGTTGVPPNFTPPPIFRPGKNWWQSAPDSVITAATNAWAPGYGWISVDGTNWAWVDLATQAELDAATGAVAAAGIDFLDDVETNGATVGQVWEWNGTNWVPATVAAGGGASLEGLVTVIGTDDWGGDDPGLGSTLSNAISFKGYSTANATNNSKWGDAFFCAATAMNEKYYGRIIAFPAAMTRIGSTGTVLQVRATSTNLNDCYGDLLLDDTIFATNIFNARCTTANEWTSYNIPGTGLPTTWTNAVPGYDVDGFHVRMLDARLHVFNSKSNSIQFRLLIDED